MRRSRAGDRRRFPRWAVIDGRTRVSILPGVDVRILNVSAGGVLVHAAQRLLPGTQVDLQLQSTGRRWALKGQIVRCHVSALPTHEHVRYRAAIQFAVPIGTADYVGIQGALGGDALDGFEGYPLPAASSPDP
jgi:hypothetical protein